MANLTKIARISEYALVELKHAESQLRPTGLFQVYMEVYFSRIYSYLF